MAKRRTPSTAVNDKLAGRIIATGLMRLGWHAAHCSRSGEREVFLPGRPKAVPIHQLLKDITERSKHPLVQGAFEQHETLKFADRHMNPQGFEFRAQPACGMLSWAAGLRSTRPSFTRTLPALCSETVLAVSVAPEELSRACNPRPPAELRTALQEAAAWRLRASALFYEYARKAKSLGPAIRPEARRIVSLVPALVKAGKKAGWLTPISNDFPFDWFPFDTMNWIELDIVEELIERHLLELREAIAIIEGFPPPDGRLGVPELEAIVADILA